MLLGKTSWFWKSGLVAISFVLILSISGCSDALPEENTVSETVINVQAIPKESQEDAEENKLADLETIRGIVNRLGENGYSEYPFSEVVGFTENSDGTITLTANVVFPHSGNSKVYAHEVVVCPLEGGGVQYVFNRIIPSEDNSEETWHTPRLTAEEWEELYGGE